MKKINKYIVIISILILFLIVYSIIQYHITIEPIDKPETNKWLEYSFETFYDGLLIGIIPLSIMYIFSRLIYSFVTNQKGYKLEMIFLVFILIIIIISIISGFYVYMVGPQW
ncbi:MAG: hypothetical protein N2749_00285 [Clostridia bacterium]|nr:hypothetical protein [Clostridia bacterium]